ncbi:MAG: hypothetical protein BMS9Abin36_2072 [Gammaproteobacteria bacterium]|nr:MAG: hypothetical protein BMS9Abin36_2072 [Gammaproteobacteria bacterium]
MKKTIMLYLFGSLLAILVFVFVIELVTRSVSYVSGNGFTLALHELDPLDQEIRDIYVWHPFTGFIYRKNTVFEGSHPNSKKKARIFIGADGFMTGGPGLEIDKKPNEIRIAVIGASTSANVNLTFEENWPGVIAARVARKFPHKTVTVLNAAVPGFDTAQSIGNLATRVIHYKPDVVLIYHAYNDLKAVRPQNNFAPDYTHIHTQPYGQIETPPVYIRLLNKSMAYVRVRNKYRESKQSKGIGMLKNYESRLSTVPSIAEEVFEHNIRSLVAIARSGGAIPILSSFATLHDLHKDYNIEKNVMALSSKQKIELVSLAAFIRGLKLEGIQQGLLRYNAVLKRLASTLKTGWVDNASLVPHEDKYFVDRVHFSEQGAIKMAENYYPEVIKALAQ